MDPCCETDKDLLTKLKKKLSCNGHMTNGQFALHGDHKNEVYSYLLGIGITADRIKHSGTGK